MDGNGGRDRRNRPVSGRMERLQEDRRAIEADSPGEYRYGESGTCHLPSVEDLFPLNQLPALHWSPHAVASPSTLEAAGQCGLTSRRKRTPSRCPRKIADPRV